MRWPSLLVCALLQLACATPPKEAVPTPATASFDVLVAGVPAACCSTCEAIELSIRNTSDAPVVIDWSSTRMAHNGVATEQLVVDGPEPTIDAHSTWQGRLRPKPGAPHATSLEEGKLRNGRYSIQVAVRSGDALATSSTDVNIDYGADSTNPPCPPSS